MNIANAPKCELRRTMSAKKRITKKELDAIERAAKREEQKAAGAQDGRFRPKVVPSKKKYSRKGKKGKEEDTNGKT
jgi:hypothetical protein